MKFDTYFTDLTHIKALSSRVGFNVCDYAGADAAEVARHRAELAAEFRVPVENLVIPRQTHSANVAVVTAPTPALPDTDGLVTANQELVLCINTADCLPLLLVEPEAGVIAAVHCGWRGTVACIAARAVQLMIESGADPTRIVAAMGPCIGPECFEVGEEVAEQFPAECVIRHPGRKPHVNLPLTVAIQLPAGCRVSLPPACSRCSTAHYSVRRQGRTLPARTLTAIRLIK